MSRSQKSDHTALRAVFDTNVLVDTMRDPLGAPARLFAAVREGTIVPIASDAVRREYAIIIQRIHPTGEDLENVRAFVESLEVVIPKDTDVVIDDDEDYKFVTAAIGGDAAYLVSSDRHLLDVGEIEDVRIITPVEAIAIAEEEGSVNSPWQSWVKGLGIG